MKIVGVGCGPGMLTEEAARAVSKASSLYGSRRAIELAKEHIQEGCHVQEITDYRSLRTLPRDSVILSTGDPMLAGLGYLEGDVIPGISSLQVALARMHLPASRISVVVAHGRDHENAFLEACQETVRGKVVYLLADPSFDIPMLAGRLLECSPAATITLCEDLGYPQERIVTGTVDSPPVPRSGLFSLIIDPGAGKDL
ncbi:MAG: cobalt-precorrin-7 (C(5))-methyltransferase [Methanolinea sp.]|nr:cobalt-precorrin-7 (C(5))-methyltransferase [Methanolinea sp.]